MSGSIPVMPLDTLREKVGQLIEEAKTRNLPMSTLTLLSIGEYLKDARRWQFVRDNEFPMAWSQGGHNTTPEQFQKWVDEQIRRYHDRQGSICPGERRSDGVQGDQGG